MMCTNPFRMKKPEGGIIELPCGHCMACKIAKSREWASRIIHEMVYYDKSVFITLTYADDCLPANLSISKRELQLFHKRLRRIYTGHRLRYFACGEYGDGKGSRRINPHYHAIIFGIGRTPDDIEKLELCWSDPATKKQRGFVYTGTVTFQSARYVARYIEKKYNGKKEEEEYTSKGLETPFCLMSKGLGKNFVLDNQEYLSENLGFTVQGEKCGLPRYYRTLTVRNKDKELKKVLDVDKNDFIAQAITKGRDLLAHYAERKLIDANDFEWSVAQAKKDARDQAERTLNAKINLRPKKL